MSRILAVLLALLLPISALAQSWPIAESPFVNDYADVIEDAGEARITDALTALRTETGVEATVLTILSRAAYAPEGSFEAFATGLLNAWGIGDPAHSNGILVLVVVEDRQLRVELGAGYGSGFNPTAQAIVDVVFLPAFRDQRYSDGIEAGTEAVINLIARPRHAAAQPPADPRAAPPATGH